MPAPTDGHRIVVLTGTALRHQRFALRLQREFGDLVVAWYEFVGASHPAAARQGAVASLARELSGHASRSRGIGRVVAPIQAVVARHQLREFYGDYVRAQERQFAREVEDLRRFARISPTRASPSDLRNPEWVRTLGAHRPHYLLTLGGPMYPPEVLETASGVCINQHAGRSPDFRGNFTTEWAAFHRRYEHISVTVHVTTPRADAGPIIRRSEPCILPGDSVADVFCRVVALGTELMIDVMHEAISSGELTVYDQPSAGIEYRSAQFAPEVALAVRRDFRRGLPSWRLDRLREF